MRSEALSLAQPPVSSSGLLVSLARPRWVGFLILGLLGVASLALTLSAYWSGLSIWWQAVALLTPFVLYALDERRSKAILRGRVLVIRSNNSWQLAFFSEDSGLTDSIEVIVRRRWHHFFGISLSLKLQNHPHIKTQTITTVVWRHGLDPAIFHEVALQAARQCESTGLSQQGDAA